MRRTLRCLFVIGLALIGVAAGAAIARAQVAAVAAAPLGSAADLEALRERAAAFWAARVAGDIQTQWELLEPRGRGRLTAQEYAAGRGGVKYLAHQIESATAQGFFGTVKVKLIFQPALPPSAASRSVPPQAGVVEDGWVRIGGVWYRRLDEGQSEKSQTRQP